MRGALFCLTLLCGIVVVAIALLMPAHLRAIDPYVLKSIGERGKSLIEATAETATQNPAVAKLFLATAEELRLPGTDDIVEQLRLSSVERTRSRTILEKLEELESGRIQVLETPVLTALRKSTNRAQLAQSFQSVEARQILLTRDLTNLTIFASARSAAGLPLDVAALTTAFLMEQRAFSPALPLRNELLRLAGASDTQALEETYLSIFALARRFSSEQIIALVANIPSTADLNEITRAMQERTNSIALIYSAAVLSQNGGGLTAFLQRFQSDADRDLGVALAAGIDALKRLLEVQQPVYRCSVYTSAAESRVLQFLYQPLLALGTGAPTLALLVKFGLLALGGFLLAYATRFRRADTSEDFVYFPRFRLARRLAFACVFLLLAVLIGEPYLAQGEQKPPPPPLWRFPITMAAATSPPKPTKSNSTTPMIDQHTILAIATFLVLQGIIYGICLVKIAEIRKQPVANETKLKLLENEDLLFDGGLYCGLFGTAASLILLTLGVIKPSLVSAYSSTLLGILFVALLKIGHVRPLKRRLLLESSKPLAA